MFEKTAVRKIPKVLPIYWSRSLCKTDSRYVSFATSTGSIHRFPFFNPVFKSTKIRFLFVTIRKNVPDNWTKIGYTFRPVKYRPNKRSGKLRIKSQIVRVTISKLLLAADGDMRYLRYTFQWQDIDYFYYE